MNLVPSEPRREPGGAVPCTLSTSEEKRKFRPILCFRHRPGKVLESAMSDCPPPAPHRAGDEASNRNMALLSAALPAEATSAVASSSLVGVPSSRAPQRHDHRPAIRPSRVARSDRDARATERQCDRATERPRHRDTATPPRNRDTERPGDRETERLKPRSRERASEKRRAAVGRPGFRKPRRSWRAERGRARAAAAAVRAAREAPRRERGGGGAK